MHRKNPHFHSFTIVNSRPQAVVVAVSFTDQHGKHSFVLGRSDPRYHDKSASCININNNLPIGELKFVAGMMENSPDASRTWLHSYPSLRQSLQAISTTHPEVSPPFARQILHNALKEMSEEMGMTLTAMKDILQHPTIRYLHADHEQHVFHGKPLDVHFVHIDLGQLSPNAIKTLQHAIHPGDDTIQSLIIDENHLTFDADGSMFAQLHAGISRVKNHFDGFPEIHEWDARRQSHVKAIIGARVCGIGDPNQHKAILRTGARHWGAITSIHGAVRGLEGIDTNSLHTGAPIPIMADNAPVIQAICGSPLKREAWSIAPPNNSARGK